MHLEAEQRTNRSCNCNNSRNQSGIQTAKHGVLFWKEIMHGCCKVADFTISVFFFFPFFLLPSSNSKKKSILVLKKLTKWNT